MGSWQRHHRRKRQRQSSFLVATTAHLGVNTGWIAAVFVWARAGGRDCGAWGASFICIRSHDNCALVSGDNRRRDGRLYAAFPVGSLELSTASGLAKAVT